MGKVVVFNHLTLDGVMQAPGRPDEDRRGGFEHGGWAQPRGDAVMARIENATGRDFLQRSRRRSPALGKLVEPHAAGRLG
jgi:hypothetical protein